MPLAQVPSVRARNTRPGASVPERAGSGGPVHGTHHPAGRAPVGEEAVHGWCEQHPVDAAVRTPRRTRSTLASRLAWSVGPARGEADEARHVAAQRARARGTAGRPTRPRRPARERTPGRRGAPGHPAPRQRGRRRGAGRGHVEHEAFVGDLERLDRHVVVLGVERRALPLGGPALAEVPLQGRLTGLVEQLDGAGLALGAPGDHQLAPLPQLAGVGVAALEADLRCTSPCRAACGR